MKNTQKMKFKQYKSGVKNFEDSHGRAVDKDEYDRKYLLYFCGMKIKVITQKNILPLNKTKNKS